MALGVELVAQVVDLVVEAALVVVADPVVEAVPAEQVVQAVVEVAQVAAEVEQVVALVVEVALAVALVVGAEQVAALAVAPLVEMMSSLDQEEKHERSKVSMKSKLSRRLQREASSIWSAYKSPTRRIEVNAHLSKSLQNLLLLVWRHLLPELPDPLQYSVADEVWQLAPPLNCAANPVG